MGTSGICDNYYYRMNHEHRGYFLIMGVENFDSKVSRRIGNEEDMKKLENTFGNLGFRTIRVKKDPTRKDMLKAVEQLAALDHSKNDCVGMAIMSHGDLDRDGDDIVYGRDAKTVKLISLLEPLSNRTDLHGKPKLIFVQACRGRDLDRGMEIPANQNSDSNGNANVTRGTHDLEFFPTKFTKIFKMEDDKKPRKKLTDTDFLIHYSTPRGYYSWRSQSRGSIFIQTVCDVLSTYTCKKDNDDQQLSDLLTKVNCEVANEYKSSTPDKDFNGCKLMPVLTTKLRKGIIIPHRCPKSELPHPVEVQSGLDAAFQKLSVK